MRALNLHLEHKLLTEEKTLTSEQVMIAELAKGNTSVLNKLYKQYSGLFYTIASRYSSNSQEAEDFVQDAFVQIFKKAGTFSFQGSFEGWMKRILINICLSALRKNRILLDDSVDSSTEFSGYSQNNWSLESMTAEEIINTIDELPLGCKTVLNLNVLEGFSHKEIGEKLGITESASRSQLTKARSKLKVLLEQKKLIER